MPGLGKDLQDLRLSKINKKEDISGRELKEIQNDFSIFKTNQNADEKDFPLHRMNSNRTGVSNLTSSKSQFLVSERNRLLRKTTSSTSKVSAFNHSLGNQGPARDKHFSPNFSQKQMKEMLDSDLKAKIVKSNIEKNIEKHKEVLQDQLVKNELISREASKSPQSHMKGETFGLGELDKSREQRARDNLRNLPIKTGKRRKPKQKRRDRRLDSGERPQRVSSDFEDRRGHSAAETESNTDSTRREMGESTQQSQASQQTTKMLELKYQQQRRKFDKKNYTFHEIIQNQQTNKRQIHQKHNSLSILGFKTKQNTVDALIREKQERREQRSRREALTEVEINETDEFDTEKTRVSQVNKDNYNALMSKLKKSAGGDTFRRKKRRMTRQEEEAPIGHFDQLE